MTWYAQSQGQVFGPYDDAQLKTLASQSRISPDTHVGQSQEGPWVLASRLKGLFASGASSASAAPPAVRPLKVQEPPCFKCIVRQLSSWSL